MFYYILRYNDVITYFHSGHHMEQMNAKNQSSLKARLYVKLQGKKMQEFSPLGLYHMISACLTIVLTSESDDMVKQNFPFT